jgi:WhiB family redox-sensing transcriptional regulator
VVSITAADLKWQDRARCAETDPEIFSAAEDESPWPAKRVCVSCEVQAPCLLWALDHREPEGIWGGLTEAERRRLALNPTPARIRAALENAGKKTCTQCGVPKILDDFSRARARDDADSDGWRANCRECRNASDREKRKAA